MLTKSGYVLCFSRVGVLAISATPLPRVRNGAPSRISRRFIARTYQSVFPSLRFTGNSAQTPDRQKHALWASARCHRVCKQAGVWASARTHGSESIPTTSLASAILSRSPDHGVRTSPPSECPICGVHATTRCPECHVTFCSRHLYFCSDCGLGLCGICLDLHSSEAHWCDSDTSREAACVASSCAPQPCPFSGNAQHLPQPEPDLGPDPEPEPDSHRGTAADISEDYGVRFAKTSVPCATSRCSTQHPTSGANQTRRDGKRQSNKYQVFTIACAGTGCKTRSASPKNWFAISIQGGRFACRHLSAACPLTTKEMPVCGHRCAQLVFEQFLATAPSTLSSSPAVTEARAGTSFPQTQPEFQAPLGGLRRHAQEVHS